MKFTKSKEYLTSHKNLLHTDKEQHLCTSGNVVPHAWLSITVW